MFQLRAGNYRRLAITFLILLLFVFYFSVNVFAVRINEVMPHTNNSLNNEWVELYNNESHNITITNWKIGDKSSNDTISLNISAFGFALIVDSSNINCSLLNISNVSCIGLATIGAGLNDDDETAYLYDNSSNLISSFSWSNSIKSSGNSWQYYNSMWQSCSPTPGQENICLACIQNQSCSEWSSCMNGNKTRTCINTTTNCTNITTIENQSCASNTNASLYIELKWNDSEIINGNNFSIDIGAYNLENKTYDLKIYMTFEENETIISYTYNENDSKWKSSNYYVNAVLVGGGNKSTALRLKIDNDYDKWKGDSLIKAKLRVSNTIDIVAEVNKSIEILNPEENTSLDNSQQTTSLDTANDNTTSLSETNLSVISLNNPKNIKSLGEKVYKSKTQYIKQYAIYGFALLCVVIIIYLIKRKV